MSAGYVDPRGIYYPPSQPYLAYGPGTSVRFFRSQNSWNGEGEKESQYSSSPQIAGWAAARPNMNRTPFVEGAYAYYTHPSGPTSPRDLMQQAAVPPNFPAGDWRLYSPDRYGPPGGVATAPGGAPGMSGADCACMAEAVAQGLKKILPELATSLAVQNARAQGQQINPRPANVEPPIRSWDFNEGNRTPAIVTDAVWTTVISHLVPVGLNAVAVLLGVEAESSAALSDVSVRIVVGGNVQRGYENLADADLGSPAEPSKVNVRAIEQQRILVQARSRTVGAVHRVSAVLRGWDFAPSLMANLDTIQGWRGK